MRRPTSIEAELLLTPEQAAWLAEKRSTPCKHGHDRSSGRLYRHPSSGALSIVCPTCLCERVARFRRAHGR